MQNVVTVHVFQGQAQLSEPLENLFMIELSFFLILNVAMGGSLGGEIDPTFTQDTMEIDYVRVYQ